MKKDPFVLTKEEQEIENAFAQGAYSSVPNLAEEKKRYAQIAQNTFARNKMITLRISERNLLRVKAAAAREGLSYQTYITALIQKNV
ncbi:antitoxin [Candidatus Kaiserbacteria bacterium]|nr:MAG: antitoxin [Candidatus Kaiserbacteria bacterium]